MQRIIIIINGKKNNIKHSESTTQHTEDTKQSMRKKTHTLTHKMIVIHIQNYCRF